MKELMLNAHQKQNQMLEDMRSSSQITNTNIHQYSVYSNPDQAR